MINQEIQTTDDSSAFLSSQNNSPISTCENSVEMNDEDLFLENQQENSTTNNYGNYYINVCQNILDNISHNISNIVNSCQHSGQLINLENTIQQLQSIQQETFEAMYSTNNSNTFHQPSNNDHLPQANPQYQPNLQMDVLATFQNVGSSSNSTMNNSYPTNINGNQHINSNGNNNNLQPYHQNSEMLSFLSENNQSNSIVHV